jgi:hypothetical protein
MALQLTVLVGGRQEPVEPVRGRAPEGLLHVVAGAVGGAVAPRRVALRREAHRARRD